jgi:hypothetical protein
MTERIVVSMEMAKEAVDHCKAARKGPCDKCERCSYDTVKACGSTVFGSILVDAMTKSGWEPCPDRAAYFKRCDECKGPRFPWAPKLDVERVREWMENYFNPTLAPGHPTVFMLERLEHLTK